VYKLAGAATTVAGIASEIRQSDFVVADYPFALSITYEFVIFEFQKVTIQPHAILL